MRSTKRLDLSEIDSVERLYAFSFQPSPPFDATDGWQIYDPLVEYKRMFDKSQSDQWRISDINQSFSVSSVVDISFRRGTSYPTFVQSY